MVEYAVMVAMIIVVAVAAISAFGTSTAGMFNMIANSTKNL